MVQNVAASIIVMRRTKVVTQLQSVVCEYIPINALLSFTDLASVHHRELLTLLEQLSLYVIINNCSSCFIINRNPSLAI